MLSPGNFQCPTIIGANPVFDAKGNDGRASAEELAGHCKARDDGGDDGDDWATSCRGDDSGDYTDDEYEDPSADARHPARHRPTVILEDPSKSSSSVTRIRSRVRDCGSGVGS